MAPRATRTIARAARAQKGTVLARDPSRYRAVVVIPQCPLDREWYGEMETKALAACSGVIVTSPSTVHVPVPARIAAAIETDPNRTTAEGGTWWDVAVPDVSERAEVRAAREQYGKDKVKQRP